MTISGDAADLNLFEEIDLKTINFFIACTNDDNSSSLLTVLGAGFDYILSDNLSVGAHAYLNNSFDMDHKEFFFTALVGLNIRLY